MKNKGTLAVIWYIVALELVLLTIVIVCFKTVDPDWLRRRRQTQTTEPAVGEQEAEKLISINGVEISRSNVIQVHFAEAQGALGYEVSYRAGDEEWSRSVAAATDFSFTAEQPGVEYGIRVRAYYENGEYGPYSEEYKIVSNSNKPVVSIEKKANSYVKVSWRQTMEHAQFLVQYRRSGAEEWIGIETGEESLIIGGLKQNTDYEVRVTCTSAGMGGLTSEILPFVVQPNDYGDPFYCAYGVLKLENASLTVPITAENGCLGAPTWAQYKTVMYQSAEKKGQIGIVDGGTRLMITADDNGNYVYRLNEREWTVHVQGTIGGIEQKGWVQANALLIDLQKVFPSSNQYSIQYNRTNAYASIFTIGGNGKQTDNASNKDTRFNPLKVDSADKAMTVSGYNSIADVTDKKLANYGSATQMPVIWDLAVELLQCQRNALENGRCLLIYDGYRPNATSKQVNSIVTKNAYLRTAIGNKTLANAFVGGNYGEGNYIATTSSHNKGIAVDLTMMNYKSLFALNKEVEMQTKIHTLDFRSNMKYNTADANLLINIMTEQTGLAYLKGKQEWWHFELGNDTAKYPYRNQYVFADYEL